MINRITLEECQKISEYLFAKPAQRGKEPLVVAITDEAACLFYLCHMDGRHTRSGSLASAKAFTSARMERTTLDLLEFCQKTNRELAMFACPGLTATPGGTPLHDEKGQLLGGIGVSGWTSAEDQELADECAQYLLSLRQGKA
jgi:uncharacterized protein GlcG (DUF336 family)